ncbi:sushi domain-containing protein 1 isoform X3 [Alosa pseudoharengus]|uniref:sushi domain-containing protein 1 isoform X3 n=1 Tax=Alosa pseudoharengus TaxID=34774 RepID=UPI003F8BD60E
MALMGTVIMAFLLHSTPSILKDTEVAGNIFDVCVTCHPNATCDLKTDGSGGYACNCMYGFVGNGRTHCEDKDECQIGANFICGDHTACHNTHGSYYCTCLSGYAPTNNMPVFIPNDGSYCQDIDECQVQGVCGEGGLCRNTDGNFECECQIGYHVKGGTVPFHPHRGKAFCEAVDCGPPPSVPHAVQVSVSNTSYRSVITYGCQTGFLWQRGDNSSLCTSEGNWTGPSLICEARCGHVPELAHAELVWDNESIAIHRCADGYYAHSGLTVSTCGVDGSWQAATLQCREIRYGIRQLEVFNERCLRWLSDGKKEDYRVIFVGRRDYQKPFVDKRREAFSSQHLRPHVCLKLLPATNYTINITAVLARSSTVITTNTTIPAAPVPEVMFRDVEGPLPYLWVHRSHHTLDPICLYEVFVLPVEGTLGFDCNSPKSPHFLKDSSCHGEYVAAQIQVRDVGNVLNFTVGDEQHYGEFYNAPLENGRDYYIILRTTCRWGQSSKHSCVLWAKARGTSYRMRMSVLVVCGTISFFGFVVLIGYYFTGYFKN